MLLSVIVPTYRRPEALSNLLESLAAQSYGDFEVLIVDASGDDARVREVVARAESDGGAWRSLRLISSERGRTRQRNVALAEATGELVCFFDDDVTFAEDFMGSVVAVFQRDAERTIGGITAYEPHLYGKTPAFRHLAYRRLGLFTTLIPGAIGRCGLPVPLTLQQRFHGQRDVDWLPGFCMIYRRESLDGVWFDERQDWGEDLAFSGSVGQRSRLVICGDLEVRHHVAAEQRQSSARAWYGIAYGIALRHLHDSRGPTALLALAWFCAVELVLDAMMFLRRPSGSGIAALFVKPAGYAAGAVAARRDSAADAARTCSLAQRGIRENR